MSATSPSPMPRLIEALQRLEGTLLVVTGAGVSAASGISTFRGSEPDAVWRQHDVDMATVSMFERDPVAQVSWYLERFAALDTARPNGAHRALAELEKLMPSRGVDFLLVTQNIDTLHEQAGSRAMIKVHGTADRMRCSEVGCTIGAPSGSLPRSEVDLETFRQRPNLEGLPRCPDCDSPLRAHVLFFDEYYTDHVDYRFTEVEAATRGASLILFIGTSFSVGVTSLMLHEGSRRRIPMFSIDPGGARLPAAVPVDSIEAAAEIVLPQVVAELSAA